MRFEKHYVVCMTPKISGEVQKKLFELGYKWSGADFRGREIRAGAPRKIYLEPGGWLECSVMDYDSSGYDFLSHETLFMAKVPPPAGESTCNAAMWAHVDEETEIFVTAYKDRAHSDICYKICLKATPEGFLITHMEKQDD